MGCLEYLPAEVSAQQNACVKQASQPPFVPGVHDAHMPVVRRTAQSLLTGTLLCVAVRGSGVWEDSSHDDSCPCSRSLER